MKKTAIIILAIALVFSACKSSKMISGKTAGNGTTVSKIAELAQKTPPKFASANVSKMSMEFEIGERKVNVSATCKIKTDSALYLSIQPLLGIEMFKAELTRDSIRLFDKMNKKYYCTDYSALAQKFGVAVDFNSVQSLITARFFRMGDKDLVADSCKLTTLPDGVSRIEVKATNLQQTTDVSAQNLLTQVLLKATGTNYSMQTLYSDYVLQNGVNFPQKIDMKINGHTTKTNCTINILKAEFNVPVRFVPTNASRFTRGEIDQLLTK